MSEQSVKYSNYAGNNFEVSHKMTVLELRTIAKERGYTGYTKLTKEALILFINEKLRDRETRENRETREKKTEPFPEKKLEVTCQVPRQVPRQATLKDLLPQNSVRISRNIQKEYTEEFLLLKNEGVTTGYIRLSQLGKPGKEGTVYLVVDKKGRKYAMKTFRKTKSAKTLEKEAFYQYLASKQGISPRVIEYNSEEKYIVMDILNQTLLDIVKAQNGKLTNEQQNQVLLLYKKLDSIGIMINDPNPLNIMEKDGKFFAIDYGFAKFTDHKDFKDYPYPNYQLMPLGLLLLLKDRCPTKDWTVIRNAISPEIRLKMNVHEWQ